MHSTVYRIFLHFKEKSFGDWQKANVEKGVPCIESNRGEP